MKTDVFVLKTDLTGYSAGWRDQDRYPESQALEDLLALSRSDSGRDLFSEVIRPGDRVVIKPNLVSDRHPQDLDLYGVITHPAIIRAVVDRVWAALDGKGQIAIADAPMGPTDFQHLLETTGLGEITEHYRRQYNFQIGLHDLRGYRQTAVLSSGGYVLPARSALAGDPAGYCEVDLGRQSAFSNLPNLHLLEGTSEGRRGETIAHHRGDVNRYLISQTILDADVLVSVPKLKTHCKVGVTLNCKGMVGINGAKNRLPHFRHGSPSEGGDQFADGMRTPGARWRMETGRFLSDVLFQRQTRWAGMLLGAIHLMSGFVANRVLHLPSLDPVASRSGNWPGNDTCWRLAADLIRVAIFADRNGVMRETPQRRFISIVDGIIGGEGNGPLNPLPRPSGVLVAGLHPISVDMVGARLMGFDERRVRYLYELSEGTVAGYQPGFGPFSPGQIRVFSNHEPWSRLFDLPVEQLLGFAPPPGWSAAIGLGSDLIPPESMGEGVLSR